jgi:hypothetical protein
MPAQTPMNPSTDPRREGQDPAAPDAPADRQASLELEPARPTETQAQARERPARTDPAETPAATAEPDSGDDQQRDPEEASRALNEVQELLRRHRVVLDLAHRQQHGEDAERHSLVEQLVERQHLNELRLRLERLHPADVAYILEALPQTDRITVWDLVKAERDGEILLEVSESVRESLIRSMDTEELVEAVESQMNFVGTIYHAQLLSKEAA